MVTKEDSFTNLKYEDLQEGYLIDWEGDRFVVRKIDGRLKLVSVKDGTISNPFRWGGNPKLIRVA